MNILKKTIIIGVLSSATFSSSVFAFSFQLIFGVDAKAGCILNSEDFNFGNIHQSDFSKAQVNNEKINLTKNLNVRCSQGTTFVLTQKGFAKNSGYDFNTMFLNGTPTSLNQSMIKYVLKTKNVISDNKFTVTSRPSSENLGLNTVSGSFHGLGIRAKTGSQFTLPILAVSHNDLGFSNYSGNYSDTVVYTITF